MSNWTFTAVDQRISAGLQAQLPPTVFDAHAHLWRTTDMPPPVMGLWAEGPAEGGVAAWRRHVGRQVGASRLTGGLMIPNPLAGDIARANAYMFEQIAGDRMLKALALVTR